MIKYKTLFTVYKCLPPGMVDFENFAIIEIEINRIEIFLKISKSILIESVFQVLFFAFSIISRISKNYDSISIQNSTPVISINIELYHFYSIISK